MKRVLCLTLALALLAGPALAVILGSNSISVTSTSASTNFSRPVSSIKLINDVVSANELYAQIFICGETVVAATTSSPIRLEPGDGGVWTYNANTEKVSGAPARGYCGISYVTANTETATARLEAK